MKVYKAPILGTNVDDSDALLPPGFCREVNNALPSQGGLSKAGGIQNTPGNSLLSNGSLPAGTNTEIGQYEDRANNRLFYFIHNSNNDHGIWYFNPNTNTHTKVLQSQYLGFITSNRISSVDCIEDILVWTDNYNKPRSIKVSDAVAGSYSATADLEQQISLFKFNPPTPAVAYRATDGALNINNVCSDSFQFSFKFIYLDNTSSLYSPPSKSVFADVYPDTNSNTNNKITVSIEVNSKVTEIVSKIYLAYIKNGDGKYFIFKEIDHDQSSVSYSEDFYNNEPATAVPASDLAKATLAPDLSRNVLINNQRVISTIDTSDINFSDLGSPSLSLSTSGFGGGTTIHMPGTTYTYGVAYFDSEMRPLGVLCKSNVEIPLATASGSSAASGGDNLLVDWTISGTPPATAAYYCIVRKKNNTISSVVQVSGLALFYKRDDDTIGATELLDTGKVYYGTKAATPSIGSYSGLIYWKIPSNLPISLDNSYRVRILPSIGQTKTEPIIAIIGDKIVTGNFGITDWSSTAQGYCYPIIQIEKMADSPDEFFYEVGSLYTITAGVHDHSTDTENGDFHFVSFENFTFNTSQGGSVNYGFPFAGGPNPDAQGYFSVGIVSQSPTTSVFTREVNKTEVTATSRQVEVKSQAVELFGKVGELFDPEPDKVTIPAVTSSLSSAFTLDYNKICSDNSRVWIEIKNKKVNNNPTSLAISDRYVLDSQINGLNSFTKIYTIPPNRTPIRKLVNIGASNVFLAIHERSATSLATYSGDNILPSPDGSAFQFLGDAKNIIGYDRELQGGYGTIYPDSVVEHGGRCWWFDPYKGEIIRYANGLTPLASKYKMKTFFKAKGDIFIDPTGRNVVAGYDPVLSMVYFTFVSADPDETGTIAFIDKEGEERWFSTFDFNPEGYSKINNRWFSFVDGEMWEHNVNSTYNNFYGDQFTTSFTMVFNPEWSKEKIVRNIATESTTTWEFPEILVRKNGVNDNQATDLRTTNFRRRNDVWYADLMRDANSFGLTADQGRVRGSILIGKAYEITAEQDDTELSEIQYVDIGFTEAPGHKVA